MSLRNVFPIHREEEVTLFSLCQHYRFEGVVPGVVVLMTKSLPSSSLYTTVHCPLLHH